MLRARVRTSAAISASGSRKMAFQPRSSSSSLSETPSERRRQAKYRGASSSPRSCAQYASSKEKRAASSPGWSRAASAHAANARPKSIGTSTLPRSNTSASSSASRNAIFDTERRHLAVGGAARAVFAGVVSAFLHGDAPAGAVHLREAHLVVAAHAPGALELPLREADH